MYEEKRSNGLYIAIIVLLSAILLALIVLIGGLLLSGQSRPVDSQLPEASQPAEPEASVPEEPVQPEAPAEVPEEPEQQPEAPSSQPQVIPPVAPVTPSGGNSGSNSGGSSANSGSSSSGNASAQPAGNDKTYTKSGVYDSKQRFRNVIIKEGDITLENKTITGDLTINRSADDVIELIDCVVEGTLYVRGGQTIILTDTRVAAIVVKEGYDQEVTIIADGETRVGTVTAYTDLVLDESGLGDKRGFSVLKVPAGSPTRSVTLLNTELTDVVLNEETELYVDGGSLIEELRVNEPTLIDGTGTIELLKIASDDIRSYIIPEEEEKVSKRYDDVEYLTHTVAVAAPTAPALSWDGTAFVFGWQGVADANATGYEYEISASGIETQTGTRALSETSVAVSDAFIGSEATFKVRTLTDKDGYSHSEWVTLSATPAVLGELKNLTVVSASAEGVVLEWDAAANAAGYHLSISLQNGTSVAVSDIISNTFTVTPDMLALTDGLACTIRVDSVAAENVKPAQSFDTVDFAVKQLTAPVVSAAYADGNVVFSWNSVADADRYLLTGAADRYTEADGLCTALVPAGEATGSFVLTVSAPGRFDQTAGILYLDSASGTAEFVIEALAVPANLAVEAITDTRLSLKWDAVEHAAGYRVTLEGSAAGSFETADPSFVYEGEGLLTAGSVYSISVQALAPAEAEGNLLYRGSGEAALVYRVEQLAQPALTASLRTAAAEATVALAWPVEPGVTYTALNEGGTLAPVENGRTSLTFTAGTARFTLTASREAGANVYYLPASSSTPTYTVMAAAHGITAGTLLNPVAAVSDPITFSGLTLNPAYRYSLTAFVNGAEQKTVVYTAETAVTLAQLLNESTAVIPANCTLRLTAEDALTDAAIYLPLTASFAL